MNGLRSLHTVLQNFFVKNIQNHFQEYYGLLYSALL